MRVDVCNLNREQKEHLLNQILYHFRIMDAPGSVLV